MPALLLKNEETVDTAGCNVFLSKLLISALLIKMLGLTQALAVDHHLESLLCLKSFFSSSLSSLSLRFIVKNGEHISPFPETQNRKGPLYTLLQYGRSLFSQPTWHTWENQQKIAPYQVLKIGVLVSLNQLLSLSKQKSEFHISSFTTLN